MNVEKYGTYQKSTRQEEVLREEFTAQNTHIKKPDKVYTSNLIMHLKALGKKNRNTQQHKRINKQEEIIENIAKLKT